MEEIHDFSRMLHKVYSSRIRRYFPANDFFRHMNNMLIKGQQAKIFVVKYKEKIIGGSVCIYSGDDAYLWFSGGMGEVRGMSLEAIRMLREQQSQVKEGSPQWMVAEQLMDICRAEPESAELIAQDLGVEAMSITEAEKKLKAYADSHKTGNFSCITPAEADRILREFYGLPFPSGSTEWGGGLGLDLADFWG